ncbi:MAG: Stk1 family PASTA domain-containing Ser/Thr kinase [Selenomonadaceae bacterium]|nr:Stk1 family PASTA domain-containing Ser/Thr kinase [Selenomonadaceae bacterium]
MIQRVLSGRYELEEKIGSGGMAEVYRAHDRLLARPVAIKILHEEYRSDVEFIERFHREAKSAARLSHPNIVSIYDVGVAGNDHYIVMEYVQSSTLKKKIQDEGALDILTATRIAKDIASGLTHAHANNIVHCDIKPHNILMTDDGHAKITDFGIARAVTESTLTYGGSVIGSVHYFSPEQARGGVITPKSDVYSLGIVLYEMLTNRLPFTGDNPVAIAMKHVEEEPISPSRYRPQIPPMLEAIVCRAMSKSPEIRPSSFELVQELSKVETALSVSVKSDPDATKVLPRQEIPPRRAVRQGLGGQTTQEETPPEEPVEQKPFYKSKLFMMLMAVVLMVGFGVGIFAAFGKVWNTEETVTVPEVKGKQLALARQILEDNKLRVNIAETYDANVPAGQVVSQDPDVGKTVKSDRLVTIYVSKGGEAIDMPDLAGLAKSAAIERLQKLGLNLGSVYEKDSSSEPGTVLSHDPTTGTKITRGQTIDLIVSRGEPEKKVEEVKVTQKVTRVPNVENASLSVAEDGIEGRGLHVGTVSYQDSNQAEGTVVAQYPSADSEVELGTYVDLVIARRAEVREPEPEPTPEPEPSREPETPQSNDFPDIPTQNDVPSREGDQAKER